MKKVLITGASGFIGINLIKYLLTKKISVFAVVRNPQKLIEIFGDSINIIKCELKNIKNLNLIMKERNFDCFYHLAWEGSGGLNRSNYSMQLSNVKYTCDAAIISKKIYAKKFIVTGTISEMIYDYNKSLSTLSDNLIYGISKSTTHKLLKIICARENINFVWARLSNVYGEGNLTGNIVSYTISELKSGREPIFSKGSQIYDLVYINDVIKALYLIGSKDNKINEYFIGSGKPRLLYKYLLAIKNIYSGSVNLGIGKRKEDGIKYQKKWFSIKPIKQDLGFKVKDSFEKNIERLIKNIRNGKKE